MAAGQHLAPLDPLLTHRNGEQATCSALSLCQETAQKAGDPRLTSTGLAPAESLGALLNALKTSAEELDRRGIEAIQSSFAQQPPLPLLAAPEEIVSAPAPAIEKRLGSGKPKFTPVEPESAGRAAVMAGPQAPPLAGPILPPQLLNFDRQNSSLRPRRKRLAIWPMVLVAALIIAVVSAFQYLTSNHDGQTAFVPGPAVSAKAAPAARARVIEEHPGARSVEVAGIRVLTSPNRKPQLQFIVINHSSRELTGLNIRIAVRSVDGPDAPLFTVSSVVPSLAPNQAKEIRADVNTPLQPSDIPDWQSLRTDVLVGRE
jgi:hypothetical protein